MLWRLRLIAQHTVIALTYKIKYAGSQQVGEIMVLVFFVYFCVVLVVYNCIYPDVWYGRSLKLGP
jgi:hypothetical protein